MFAVLIGTGLILLLIKLQRVGIWKAMYFFAVWMTCAVTLGVFMPGYLALIICFGLALLKIRKPGPITHNATEMLMYPGIAIIFVPLLDIYWALALLLVISVYDMFAVWKSKHMVKMAEFQTQSKAFAGIAISYKKPEEKTTKKTKGKGEGVQNAVLGGGDIAFPLIFAGVVMTYLISTLAIVKPMAFLMALAIPFSCAAVLFALLLKAEKGKYYPAMPFMTAGCLIGYGIVYMLTLFV